MKEIDGCGKSTQAEMLKETLERVGMNPCLVKASLAAGGRGGAVGTGDVRGTHSTGRGRCIKRACVS